MGVSYTADQLAKTPAGQRNGYVASTKPSTPATKRVSTPVGTPARLAPQVRPLIIVGIDPGVNTGFAIWHASRPANLDGMPPQPAQFVEVATYTFVQTIRRLERLLRDFGPVGLLVRVEDVRGRVGIFRQREKGGEAVQDRMAQNIGSNKRDCQLLCDFMEELGIAYEALPPKPKKTGGKVTKEYFTGMRGFPARSSQHARDAAKLCLTPH